MIKTLTRILLILALAATACQPKGNVTLQDFTLELYKPQYASGFEIIGAEGRESSILRIHNPWQGAEDITTNLFIARNGEPTPAGFEGQVIDGDIERVICMSSSHVAMFDAISEVERVVGVSGKYFISNEYVSANESVLDVGYDSEANYELIVALDPDIVLLYGITGASTIENKLRELRIPYAYIGEYLEEAPLGKTEWMVAVGEIVGQRAKAEQVFQQIPVRYTRLKEVAAAASSAKPKVMINTPYADSWVMASTSSYVARLIADAGGDYIYRKNTSNSSMPIDLEEAARLSAEADVWINVGSLTSLSEMRRQFPKFADTPCVVKGEVYNCDKRSEPGRGNDYWESGIVNPDIVLRDLIKIFHPELINEEFVYYRKLK